MVEPDTVPVAPADISASWLGQIFDNRHLRNPQTPVQIERIGEAFGFASELYSARWPTEGGKEPAAAVIKLWSTADKAGLNEINFYKTFGQKIGVRVPACYAGAADPDAERAVLVLEAIADPLQGDVLRPLGLELGSAVAREVAALHAFGLGHDRLEGIDWLSRFRELGVDEAWIADRRALFLHRFGDRLSDVSRRLLDRAELAIKKGNEMLADAPTTLLHQDFHLDNIIFENGQDPVLLDWTSCLAGPAALNVADLLFAIERLADFDALFGAYLDRRAALGRPSDREILLRQMEGAFLHRFVRGTCGAARWRPATERGRRIQAEGIDQLNKLVDFWIGRDSVLFAGLI